MVRLVGLEPTTGKSPADFKPAAYANFATAAPGVYAAATEYHAQWEILLQRNNALEQQDLPIPIYKWHPIFGLLSYT